MTEELKVLLVRDHHVRADKVCVLPNGVDPDLFTPLPREEAIRSRRLDPNCASVFAGNFAPWVDFETMLHAFVLTVAVGLKRGSCSSVTDRNKSGWTS